jgi:hypothetical protein
MIFLGLEIAAGIAIPILIQKGIEKVKKIKENSISPIVKDKAKAAILGAAVGNMEGKNVTIFCS